MATAPVSQFLNRGGAFLLPPVRPEDVFTPADFSDDQRLIGQTAEEFVQKEVMPAIPELEAHKDEHLMAQMLKKAGEIGLLGGGIPEAYGGSGLDKISAAILAEKLAAYGSFAPLPAGTSRMRTPNGGFADVYGVFAKIDGEKFSCFIVERGTPGFTAGAEEKKMGIKGSSTTPIFFENSPVPKENLLHEAGRGHVVAFNTLNAGRFSLGAYCIGGAKKILEASSKYSKERTAFGKRLCDFGLIKAKLGEMAIQIYAIESEVYRTAGIIKAAVSSPDAGNDKTKQAMQVLEEYAIESSISKVAGSEMVDYVVDEGVQIFGGYGFHEDYPVARAYRDSRVNRIFEGTNEINRMLIIQMLMKRALGGVLPLIPAAMKLGEEVLAGPTFEEAPTGPFAEEEKSLEQAKKIFLLASGTAMQKFREQLAEQQESVAALANIVMDVYAMESTLRRAQKASAARGEAASVMGDAARAFIYDAMDRVEKDARTALTATAEGDTLITQLAVLRRFSKHAPT